MSNTVEPKISIVIPAFNAAKHISNAIDSVLKQSFTNFELIIVNDGSSDESLNIIQSKLATDRRIRIINQPQNQGVAASRNQAISTARSNLIALLDADDVWHTEKLEIQFKYYQEHHCALCCTGFWFGGKAIQAKPIVNYHDLLANNLINTSSTLIDTKQVSLKFDHIRTCEDYAQWLSIARHHPIHFINQPLLTRNTCSGISANKMAMAKQRWRIYRRLEKLSFPSAAYYFFRYTLSGIAKYWNFQS